MTRFFLISKEEISNSQKWLGVLSHHSTNGAHVPDVCSLEGLQNYSSEFSLNALKDWAVQYKGKLIYILIFII